MNQLTDSLRISKTPVVIQHVTMETIMPYPVVKQRMGGWPAFCVSF
jgi:hypothetical protein